MTGLAIYGAKIIQVQFNTTSSMSNILLGMVLAPIAAVGVLFGGVLVSLLHQNPRKMLFLCSASIALSIPFAFTFLLRCNSPPFAGVTTTYEFPLVESMYPSTHYPYSSNGEQYSRSQFSTQLEWTTALHNVFIPKENDPHDRSSKLFAQCNAHCLPSCKLEDLYVVCGANKIEYFSPCLAGCTSFRMIRNKKVF